MSPLPAEVLLAMAEVAIAFTGFASLIAIFGMRAGRGARDFDLLRYWVMLESSLAALGFSFVPIVLRAVGVPEAAAWRVGSAGLAACVAVHVIVTGVLYRRGSPLFTLPVTTGQIVVSQVVYAALVLSQLANALGFLGDRVDGWYLVGMFLLFVVATAHFVLFISHAISRFAGDD